MTNARRCSPNRVNARNGSNTHISVMVSRTVMDPDLSAKLDVIAIEILTAAAKLERDKFETSTKSVARS
jgi:hypothetical protein